MSRKIVIVPQEATAAVKGSDKYEWFKYTGKRKRLGNASGKRSAEFVPGYVFGLRASSDGKKVRMITQEHGPTIVFTVPSALADSLKAAATKQKAPKAASEKVDEDEVSEDFSVTALESVTPTIAKIIAECAARFKKAPPSSKYLKVWADGFAKQEKIISKGTAKSAKIAAANMQKLLSKMPKAAKPKSKEFAEFVALTLKTIPKFMYEAKGAIKDAEIDMIFLYLNDFFDHLLIAALLAEGDFDGAADASDLDTSSREDLDNRVWEFLRGEGLYAFLMNDHVPKANAIITQLAQRGVLKSDELIPFRKQVRSVTLKAVDSEFSHMAYEKCKAITDSFAEVMGKTPKIGKASKPSKEAQLMQKYALSAARKLKTLKSDSNDTEVYGDDWGYGLLDVLDLMLVASYIAEGDLKKAAKLFLKERHSDEDTKINTKVRQLLEAQNV